MIVAEPTIDEAVTILRGIRENYEGHHGVWVMDQAMITAVNLAHRYLTAKRYVFGDEVPYSDMPDREFVWS